MGGKKPEAYVLDASLADKVKVVKVNNAANADEATHAGSADSATHATGADDASNAKKLGGKDATAYVLDASLTGYTTDSSTKRYKIQKDDDTKAYYVEVPWQAASLDPDSGLAGELNAILKDASVNYANKAGDADTLDGKHASSFALDASLQSVSATVSGMNELINDFNGDISNLYDTKAEKDDLEYYVKKSVLTGFEEVDTANNKNYKISEDGSGTYYVHVPWESGGSGGDLTDYVKYASTVEDGTWDFIDDSSRTIMRVDKLGVQSVDFIAGGHILSQKANIDEYSDPNDWWAYGD